MKFYYTYVLKSQKDQSLYIGFSENLEQRLLHHNKGLVKATEKKIPYDLIYFEACLNREDAINREKQLKTGFGRAYIKRRIT